MMPERLSRAEAVFFAKTLQPDQVKQGDERLHPFDEGLIRSITDTTPSATFLEWPDWSLGFALLPDIEPDRSMKLVEAYKCARDALELLALSYFVAYNPNVPN